MAPVSPVSVLPPTAFLATPQPLHRLVMTSPQGSVSPLVSSSSSPPILLAPNCLTSPRSPPVQSPEETDSAALDFSTKRNSGEPVLNLSKDSPQTNPPSETPLNSPLDLSVSSRKRGQDDSPSASLSPSPQPRKNPRVSTDFKPVVSPWTSPVVASHFPYFAAAVAAANNLSPKNNSINSHSSSESSLWNGRMKISDKTAFGISPSPNDATKALEKMSELSKLGADEFRPLTNSSGGSSGRHSAWQSHWLNKGAEQAKDVLKCVWCKQSFPSLAAMTTHMKEAKHCGVNVPVPPIQPPPPPIPQPSHRDPTNSTTSGPPNSLSGPPPSASSKPSSADLNLLIKETMPLPRKLVRGQDVWLGKGAEQTRQILKCMWCGQSFRSLAEMTSHMQQTQHYTNIISQEQIISWKSADDGKSGGGGASAGGASAGATSGATGAASSHVSAVLTCKVCDQAFSSLKELSNHMVKNSHYKEHIMRSITESGGRRRQTREKRKKSLPVRKLLELERAQNELKNGEGIMLMGKPGREMHSAGRITCEKCGEKIDMAVFVDHIRMCIGGGHIGSDQRNLLKNALLSSNILPPDPHTNVSHVLRESRKIKSEDPSRSPHSATDLTVTPGSPKEGVKSDGKSASPSVLNAIEKLIEKSFDSRARHGAPGYGGTLGASQGPIGSSILKRLGIDESVDYTKPLVDPQTMNMLRNYTHHHHHSQHPFARRERSGSESSSISERGRTDSLTPDRKYDPAERLMSTPGTTPEKRIQTPPSSKVSTHDESADEEIHIKKEIDDTEVPVDSNIVNVKKEEMENGDDEEDRRSYHSEGQVHQRAVKEEPGTSPSGPVEDGDDDRRSHNSITSPVVSPRQPTPVRPSSNEAVPNSPCRNSTSSPASSDRSGTPRSSIEKKSTGSLGALSSMFDNLSGGSGGGVTSETSSAAVKATSHPLAALQKLCDKTETHHHSSSSGRSGSASSVSGSHSSAGVSAQTPQTATTPGAILAFSWACNDAVVTADSIMKCAFCDTPFISKGAYRHHLSKMHFVKDGVIPDPVALKTSTGPPNATSIGSASSKVSSSGGNPATSSSSTKSPTQQNNFEESPHSKFLKYTELAKQLSSKYV